MKYNFEWDPIKAASNFRKHDVTFEQVINIFKDPMALTLHEEDDSSSDEDRWVTMGLVNNQHYLLVIHTYKDQQSTSVTIRIISARRATKNEIKQYERGSS